MTVVRIREKDLGDILKEEEEFPIVKNLQKRIIEKQKVFCLVLSDERGNIYTVDINGLLDTSKITIAKN